MRVWVRIKRIVRGRVRFRRTWLAPWVRVRVRVSVMFGGEVEGSAMAAVHL